MKLPNISVVIPTSNEENNIERLIKSLEEQTLKPKEIIVVDGGSEDQTLVYLKRLIQKNKRLPSNVHEHNNDLKVINYEKSVAKQRNKGGEIAKCKLIMFMDADVYPSKHFLEDCVKSFVKNKLEVACPITYPYKSTLAVKMVFAFFNTLFFISQWTNASGGGMCVLVTKKIFTEMNGFDNNFRFEDIEFIRRASKKGKFRIINVLLAVSDRRFVRDGTFATFVKYLFLGLFFTLGLFKLTNLVNYRFGGYYKRDKSY